MSVQVYDPYFIGLWLGDGDSNGTIISGNIDEYEITDYIKWFCDKYSFRYYAEFDKRSEKMVRHHIKQNKHHCNELKHYLITKCLINDEKRVPKECLINSRETRLNVLAGLIDSDGSYSLGHLGRGKVKFKIILEPIVRKLHMMSIIVFSNLPG